MPNSVFLTPLEQDLIELDRALLAMIDRYRHVEQRLAEDSDGVLADTVVSRLRELEGEHETFRTSLETRKLLPHAPETDLEDLKRITASIRAWIESDQTRALLDWLIESEQEWQQTLHDLASGELDASTTIKPLDNSAKAAITKLSQYQDND